MSGSEIGVWIVLAIIYGTLFFVAVIDDAGKTGWKYAPDPPGPPVPGWMKFAVIVLLLVSIMIGATNESTTVEQKLQQRSGR